MAALIAGGPNDNDDLSEFLRKILALDELKSETPAVTNIKDVLGRLMLFSGAEKAQLQLLVDAMRKAYDTMLKSVPRRQSVSSKLSKLNSLFHQFSVNEGYELCCSFEKALKLPPLPEILWQLLLKTVFKCFLTAALASTNNQPDASGRNPHILSPIEENTICYTAWYVINKLENKYSAAKNKDYNIECATTLKIMGTKLQQQTEEPVPQDLSTRWTNLVNRGGLFVLKRSLSKSFSREELGLVNLCF
uniref:Uncharacterized protein n=1 Tax=Amphimedon queenslandica TaxID=400682 RepID=A0A1X7U0B9_AMPQE